MGSGMMIHAGVRGGLRLPRLFPVIIIALLVTTSFYQNRNLYVIYITGSGEELDAYEYAASGEHSRPIQSGGEATTRTAGQKKLLPELERMITNITSNPQNVMQDILPEEFSTLDPIQYPFRGDLVKWWAYCLGDVYKFPQTKFTHNKRNRNTKRNVCERYPGSIACLYLSSPGHSVQNFTLLRSIVDEVIATRTIFTIPKPNTTVIHIRLGDILVPPCTNTTQDCFKNSCFVSSSSTPDKKDSLPQSYYDRILKSGYLPPPNETDISVVGFAYHGNSGPLRYKSSFKASHEYRNSLVKFFENAGYSVTNLGDREPDMDFVFISYAQTFVLGGGGFSKILGEMVTANGGRVVS